jgi:hypothetical protein
MNKADAAPLMLTDLSIRSEASMIPVDLGYDEQGNTIAEAERGTLLCTTSKLPKRVFAYMRAL